MYPIKYYLNTDYENMEIFGIKGLFSNLRIERESLPEGFFKYSLREGDEEYFSTVENNVVVNHSGDFICKQELDLGLDGFMDLIDHYSFLDEPMDLDKFFGVDIKLKVAEDLDEFMRVVAPHEYADNLPTGTALSEGNMIAEIRQMLEDREQAYGILCELTEMCEETSFSDPQMETQARALSSKVNNIVCSFPEKKPVLSKQIHAAETIKETMSKENTELEPEVSEF